ncbi:D-aminoacylase [bacterium]|nr:D-aminoacylase [bacterium]
MRFDTIIMGGEVVDGTKKAAFKSDVGIKGERILAIGDLAGAEAAEKIDAAGLIVAPGFIDIHTHSDFTLLVNGAAESQVHQGVTLEVIGQCGFSLAPVDDADSANVLVPAQFQKIEITWKSFGEYLARLERQDLGVNVIAMVGQGTIRRTVMQDALRPATPTETDRMVRLLEESLAEGAGGFSTGLEYWPGKSSTCEEILPLCEVAARRNVLYSTHVRNRDNYYDVSFAEALALARNSGVKLQISHIQPKFGAPPNAMAHTLDMIEWAGEAGADVAFDVIPSVWAHTGLTAALPSWALEGGTEKLIKRLQNPEEREKMKYNPMPHWLLVPARKWDRIALLRSSHHKDLIGMTFEEIGQARGVDPYDAYFDLLLEAGDDLHSLMWTSRNFSEDDVRLCLKQPECGVISDTFALAPHGALKGMIGSLNGYGWVARLFEHYVRQEGLLSLEEAVHKITSLPASRLGLNDRGILRPGAQADITIFNINTISDNSSITAPCVYPSGIEHVLVNGKFTIKSADRMDVNPGRVIR